ncbi:hypothetical protein MmiEs2_16150 [Methanimicrococcus stummii]|uniref:GLUG domain-containing protein n=1 Tax=Methanimicrococcus stummii TaxID=3028294 RepID=A0AA96VCL5_9EURY|nr:GLUG motif-containing protein [Methanimicrococcus sp. Es2]WNY29388.1 hypothetical protein MmiEs2_16150 [Methanimicrococcus sp. Es2]
MKILKSISLIAILLIAFVLMSGIALAAPIEIGSASDLKQIGIDETNYPLDGDYILINDIEITDDTWNSIGNISKPFVGTFDGQGYSITFASSTGTTTFKNFDGGSTNYDGFGLFGTVGKSSATDVIEFKNINVVLESDLTNEISSTYYYCIGSLIGNVNVSSPNYFSMNSCSLTSNGNFEITGNYSVGGLVGYVKNGVFEDCSVSGDVSVTAENNNAGGLVGYVSNNADFTGCSVSGDVSVIAKNRYAGGLVGWLSGTITDCYSTATIKAMSYAGGLIGLGYAISPSVCDISSSYFTGTVSLGSGADSSSYIGGIIGSPYGTPTVTDSFYSSDSVDVGTTGATPTTLFGTSVSSADMKKVTTYSSWDISNAPDASKTWYIQEDIAYPQLFALRSNTIPISTDVELKKIGSNDYDTANDYWYTMDADYYLIADVEIVGGTWDSIGDDSNPFTGTFNGNDFTITFMEDTDFDYEDPASAVGGAGLFGVSKNAVFKNAQLIAKGNLTATGSTGNVPFGSLVGRINDSQLIGCSIQTDGDFSITKDWAVGGLVGNSWYDSVFEDCSASISVISNNDAAGGIVGFVNYGLSEFTNCSVLSDSNEIQIIANRHGAGGLVGNVNSNGIFDNCSVLGDISIASKVDNAGGLVGYVSDGTFDSCSVSGNGAGAVTVTAEGDRAGGLVGDFNGKIENCYSTANVKANNYVGGLAGHVWYASSEFSSSYFAGTVSFSEGTTGTDIGGIAGSYYFEPTVTDCVYLTQTETLTTNIDGSEVASSTEMKKIATYLADGKVVADWDISDNLNDDTVWFIVEGQTYPLFTRDYVPADPVKQGGGSGFGGENVRVINSTAEIPGLKDDTIRETSDIPNVVSDPNADSGNADAYGEEEGTDWTLYLILGLGLIIVIAGVAYYLKKKN